ncbi:MAG: thioredoxin domain-containing protein [Proteobacteria bacterium]|nr:thioredoxin domain-containing protein [Pseudomonadota bacterium]
MGKKIVKPEQNRLSGETSPYLLQHAGNPVDWYPWSDEALDKARKENKPILLSIGYSACHWCHVMAHESFENPEIAKQMNRLFVNIKVDREERPDLDRVYQTAHQILAQRGGGWPLTVFLDPEDQMPFFAGTYFPPTSRQGMPGFNDVLNRIDEFYRKEHEGLREQAESLQAVLARIEAPPGDDLPAATVFEQARQTMEKEFDARHGGFGQAPKFPHPSFCLRLLRHWRATARESNPDVRALHMVSHTLGQMARGGLYDQLGGGFFRYSVDAYWAIPHFEKMLYDNAQLLSLYAQAWQASADPYYREIASETADWAIREMQSPGGGFYATLDADSEDGNGQKTEGAFYTWTVEEIKGLLDEDQYLAIETAYGLDRPPNFENSRWHLNLRQDQSPDADLLARARKTLLEARDARTWPARDEKIICSWNGLMIQGLAIAARALDRDELAESAMRAANFVREKLWDDETGLLSVYKDGRARFPAYLDDYAFMLNGLLELLQTRWDSQLFDFCLTLARRLVDDFEDRDHGGFFFTAHQHEKLLFRPKTFADEAIPAGNGVAAVALQRLGYLLADTGFLQAAQDAMRSGKPAIEQYPSGHATMLDALEEHLQPGETIIIRGESKDAARWQKAATLVYAPKRQVYLLPGNDGELPDALVDKRAGESTVAYLCQGHVCSEPLTTMDAMLAAIAG